MLGVSSLTNRAHSLDNYSLQNICVNLVRVVHAVVRVMPLLRGRVAQRIRVASPRTARDPVEDIPMQHLRSTPCGIGCAVEHKQEATIHRFTPSCAATVVNGNRGGAATCIADDVMDGHIRAEFATVLHLRGCSTNKSNQQMCTFWMDVYCVISDAVLTLLVSRQGASVPLTSWWSRESITGAFNRPSATASLNAAAIPRRASALA
jgi:hypothetical protein